MYQKSTKINQKSGKNRPKIEVWTAPGQVWRRLGPAWAVQGVLRAILDRSGGVLEAFGRFEAEKGGQHGSNLGSKTEPRSMKNRSKKKNNQQKIMKKSI